MADIPQIGKFLGVKLGESIHDKILPAIKSDKKEITRLKELLKAQIAPCECSGCQKMWVDFAKENNII